MDAGFKTITECRMCGSKHLAEFFDLGRQPLANSFLKKEELANPEPTYPLRVVVCEECSLVQLRDIVNPNLLFSHYVYFSSGMPASQHFRDYAEDIVARFTKTNDDLVVEIGSNDGHFLTVVQESGRKVLGIDPAKNIAALANERGVPTVADFFSLPVAKAVQKTHGKAAVIVGNNVVAHIPDQHSLMGGVSALLRDDGVFVFEAPYLVDMFENLTFDTIYHEHFSYLAVRPLFTFLQTYGLDIFDVQVVSIQGQSIRVFACKKGQRPIEPSVQELINKEKEMGLDKLETYRTLASNIYTLKAEIVTLLQKLKSECKTIAAYGAPAKGNTLLNYYSIGTDILDYATEALPSKIGLYTPGMHIPVVDIEWARRKENLPDYFLLLAWNYTDAVLAKEKAFRDKGGKFILPVGHQRII